jgi:hypothetical protein
LQYRVQNGNFDFRAQELCDGAPSLVESWGARSLNSYLEPPKSRWMGLFAQKQKLELVLRSGIRKTSGSILVT